VEGLARETRYRWGAVQVTPALARRTLTATAVSANDKEAGVSTTGGEVSSNSVLPQSLIGVNSNCVALAATALSVSIATPFISLHVCLCMYCIKGAFNYVGGRSRIG
jgi:hypothetical protein